MTADPLNVWEEVRKLEHAHRFDFMPTLGAYLHHGHVYSAPGRLIVARPVDSSAPEHLLRQASVRFFQPDAWYIALAVGRGVGAWFFDLERTVGTDLPKVVFFRRNSRKYIVPKTRLRNLLCNAPCAFFSA